LEINGGVFEVKATNGDTLLGGEDFDEVMMMMFTLYNYNMWVTKIYTHTDQPKQLKYKMIL
jgi:hypothetical protein